MFIMVGTRQRRAYRQNFKAFWLASFFLLANIRSVPFIILANHLHRSQEEFFNFLEKAYSTVYVGSNSTLDSEESMVSHDSVSVDLLLYGLHAIFFVQSVGVSFVAPMMLPYQETLMLAVSSTLVYITGSALGHAQSYQRSLPFMVLTVLLALSTAGILLFLAYGGESVRIPRAEERGDV